MTKGPEVDEDALVNKYVNDKVSMNTLAKEWSTGRRQVKKTLIRHGVTIRPPYVVRTPDEKLLRFLEDDTLSYSWIGSQMGLSATSVRDRARRLGFKRIPGAKGIRRCSTPIFTEELDKKIADLRKNERLTAIEIADVVGITRYRIELRLRQLGLGRNDMRVKQYKSVRIHGPHRRNNSGTLRAHILIAEKNIGRPLKDFETVHHIDLDRYNNEPDNLYVYDNSGIHMRAHAHLRRIATNFVFKLGLIGFRDGQYFLKEETATEHFDTSEPQESLVAKWLSFSVTVLWSGEVPSDGEPPKAPIWAVTPEGLLLSEYPAY